MVEIDDINNVLSEIVTYICKNPSIFVSETDIHFLIMAALMKIPELKYTHLYQTNATIGKNRNDQVSKISYKTMAVHKEYGHPDIPNARSDIVILNPNDILEIDDPLDLKVRKKWIVPDYIFEFGTEKAAGSETVFKEHLENDIEKACKSNKRGYIIHIQRNMCESEGELLKNNRSKYEGYSHVITNITREITTNERFSKVRLLVVLIDIGNKGRRIFREGKIKIFKNGEFIGINQNVVKDEIKIILR